MDDDLGNLLEEPANDFHPLRCPCSDDNDAMTSMLEQTFRMIMLGSNTLVSCSHETAMQWEITEDTVQLVRCIIKPGSLLLISNLISLEDGIHFLISQIDGPCSRISMHSIEAHAALYETILDHITIELMPLSIDHFLDLIQPPLLHVHSLSKPGQSGVLALQGSQYVAVSKLARVDNVVVVLYSHHLDVWSISLADSSLLSHYDFQTVKRAVGLEMIDESKIIIMSEESGLQAETLICLKNVSVVSETLIPNIEGELLCPLSNTSIITTCPGTDRMGQYIENFVVHSLNKNLSCKFAVGLYANERYSLFCHLFPCSFEIIVFTTHAKFFKCKINQDMIDHIRYAELRKNARVLAQAHRTFSSSFKCLPVEICIKIITLTDHNIPDKEARQIVALYFCKPYTNEIDHLTC